MPRNISNEIGNRMFGQVTRKVRHADPVVGITPGLPELMTTSIDAYETLALRLANNPDLLASIRTKLSPQKLTAPLFDTLQFTRHIEAAYSTMWERSQRGETAEGFFVAP